MRRFTSDGRNNIVLMGKYTAERSEINSTGKAERFVGAVTEEAGGYVALA